MKKSFFKKIFISYVVLVSLLGAVTLALSVQTVRHSYQEAMVQDLVHLGQTVLLSVKPLFLEGQFLDMENYLKQVSEKTQTQISLMDPAGYILVDTAGAAGKLDGFRERADVLQAISGGVGQSRSHKEADSFAHLFVSLPIEQGGELLALIRLNLSLKNLSVLVRDFVWDMVKCYFVIFIVFLLGFWMAAGKFFRAMKDLVFAANRLALGDFKSKVYLDSEDEVQELAESFNHMTDQIQELFEEITSKQEELGSLFASIQGGVCVLSEEGEVLLCNDGFEQITGEPSRSKPYWQVVRNLELVSLIKKTQKRQKGRIREIEWDDHIYLVSTSYLETRKEVVVLLQDVSEIKNLQEVKRDFVTNVSHELRTPLTAIKGFAMTLEDEEQDDEKKHYLQIIHRHTNRLINIVEDLLSLSQLEDTAQQLELSEIDIVAVIEQLGSFFAPKLEDKPIDYAFVHSVPSLNLSVDPFKFEQLLINLIDNAIKYTEKGQVTVTLEEVSGAVRILVKDTGIGIPQEDQTRIFERFYTVDKSRSRKLGSTGLGLAIVKHIALLHDANVELINSSEQGSCFALTFFPEKNQKFIKP